MPDLRIRQAVRAVLVDPADRVLLVRFEFPSATRWALPGGGIEPGEGPEQALRRELHEELGIVDAEIGPHVWSRVHHVAFLDGSHDGQHDRIHLVRLTEAVEPVPTLPWDQLNHEYLFELRWWTLSEIVEATHVHFVPEALARHLATLLGDGPPAEPIDVGV